MTYTWTDFIRQNDYPTCKLYHASGYVDQGTALELCRTLLRLQGNSVSHALSNGWRIELETAVPVTVPARPRVKHRTMVYVGSIPAKRYNCSETAVKPQLRHLIRLAVACHEAGTPYDVTWTHHLMGAPDHAEVFRRTGHFIVTFTATGGVIPTARPLAKPATARLAVVANGWKPAPFEAEYRLEAYASGTDRENPKRSPGFVIEHSCGLSLVFKSDTGEWDDRDATRGWTVTHTASGMRLGRELPFKRAVAALVETSGIDWTKESPAGLSDAATRAGLEYRAKYEIGHTRDTARRRLAA